MVCFQLPEPYGVRSLGGTRHRTAMREEGARAQAFDPSHHTDDAVGGTLTSLKHGTGGCGGGGAWHGTSSKLRVEYLNSHRFAAVLNSYLGKPVSHTCGAHGGGGLGRGRAGESERIQYKQSATFCFQFKQIRERGGGGGHERHRVRIGGGIVSSDKQSE